MNTKAISPLISVVLMVMIAVSIGSAVMIVINEINQEQLDTTRSQQELIQCGIQVEMRIFESGNNDRVCINQGAGFDGEIVVFFENTGLKDVPEWRFIVIGDGIYDNVSIDADFAVGDIKGYRFRFDGTGPLSTLESIRLYPKVTGGPNNPLVVCREPNLDFDAATIASWTDCDDVAWDNSV